MYKLSLTDEKTHRQQSRSGLKRTMEQSSSGSAGDQRASSSLTLHNPSSRLIFKRYVPLFFIVSVDITLNLSIIKKRILIIKTIQGILPGRNKYLSLICFCYSSGYAGGPSGPLPYNATRSNKKLLLERRPHRAWLKTCTMNTRLQLMASHLTTNYENKSDNRNGAPRKWKLCGRQSAVKIVTEQHG